LVALLVVPVAVQADLVVTLFEAPDGTTDVEILGSGQTTDSGSATFSVALDRQFLGSDDNSDHLGTAMTLSGVVGGVAVPFVPGLRLLDGAAVDQFQFSLGGGYATDDSYAFSGVGNFPTLDFGSLTSSGVFTSPGSGDAMDFAEFSFVIEVPEPASMWLRPVAIALVAGLWRAAGRSRHCR
jgi:hypothetical protein